MLHVTLSLFLMDDAFGTRMLTTLSPYSRLEEIGPTTDHQLRGFAVSFPMNSALCGSDFVRTALRL